jgi:hypothetical protein
MSVFPEFVMLIKILKSVKSWASKFCGKGPCPLLWTGLPAAHPKIAPKLLL